MGLSCGVIRVILRLAVLIQYRSDDGLLLIAPTALEATLRLRPKFNRFDLSLQSWLYNI